MFSLLINFINKLLSKLLLINPTIKPIKKTLVLDLDETLIYSSLNKLNNNLKSVKIEIKSLNNHLIYQCYKRPNLDEFLSITSKWFDLVIFTASIEVFIVFYMFLLLLLLMLLKYLLNIINYYY